MSLVNDALKRAQEQHANQAPRTPGGTPATPHMRVGPAPERGRTWLLPVLLIFAAGALTVGGVMYLKSKKQLETSRSGNPVLAFFNDFASKLSKPAPPPPATNVNAEPAGPHIIIVTSTKTNVLTEEEKSGKFQARNLPLPAPEPAPAVAPPATPAPGPVHLDGKKPDPLVVDNGKLKLLPVVANPPKTMSLADVPEAIKLQGILYSSSRPAAIINGRTVFVGDRIGDMRIQEILPRSVTMLYQTNTIVVKLP